MMADDTLLGCGGGGGGPNAYCSCFNSSIFLLTGNGECGLRQGCLRGAAAGRTFWPEELWWWLLFSTSDRFDTSVPRSISTRLFGRLRCGGTGDAGANPCDAGLNDPRSVSASVISSRYLINASKSDLSSAFSLSAIVINVFCGELSVFKELLRSEL